MRIFWSIENHSSILLQNNFTTSIINGSNYNNKIKN